MQGRIIMQISNLYTVNANGNNYECTPRGKFRNLKISPLVGDLVDFDSEKLTIDKILPRKNELKRPVVANVDVALIVTSVKKPDLSKMLLDKLISIVTYNKIEPIICLTKLDLLDKNEKKEIKNIFKYYKKIGIKVVTNNNSLFLKYLLKNKLVVLTGQTGAGKSSLLNKINKNLNIETHEISNALNRGVHTTRHTEIYKIGKAYFADTPGFSSVDLFDIKKEDLQNCFIEFKEFSCKYRDCLHVNEDGCKIRNNNLIMPSRYENYLSFLKEINENSSKLYK